jgi:hypothetical protein
MYPLITNAQALRFSNHREIQPPEYATVRIGPFYSLVEFSQSAGYRYVTTHGTGTDFLFGTGRGVIKKDGSDFPLISSLTFRNYMILAENADIDLSVQIGYAKYPRDTQEDEFFILLPEEGILGNISTEFAIGPFFKGTLYDNISYRTDFIDTRGMKDVYGGTAYEHLQNVAGTHMDWLLAKDMDAGLSFSREDVFVYQEQFEEQEHTTLSATFLLERELLPSLTAGLQTGISFTDYRVQTRPDSHLIDYSIFAKYQPGTVARLTERTSVSFGIGYSSGRTEELENEDTDHKGEITGYFDIQTALRKDLMHSLRVARSLQQGFNTPFEKSDRIEYRLKWNDEITETLFYSSWNRISLDDPSFPDYTDWTTGLELVYRVYPGISLLVISQYNIRNNEDGAMTTEPELQNDYNTWITRAGTEVGLTRYLKFATSIQHIVRTSMASELEYTRDIFSAELKYTRTF